MKVYHITYLDKNYPDGKVEAVKKFKTEEEAREYIEKEHKEQIEIFGVILDKLFTAGA